MKIMSPDGHVLAALLFKETGRRYLGPVVISSPNRDNSTTFDDVASNVFTGLVLKWGGAKKNNKKDIQRGKGAPKRHRT